MESKTKTDDRQETSDYIWGSKAEETNNQSKTGNVKPDMVSEGRQFTENANDSEEVISFMGWTIHKPKNPTRKIEPAKATYRFIPRVLHTQNKNSRIPGKSPNLQDHSTSVMAETLVTEKKRVTNTPQWQDVVNSQPDGTEALNSNVQCDSDPKPTKSSKSPVELKNINTYSSSSRLPSVPADKENAAAGSEPYDSSTSQHELPRVSKPFYAESDSGSGAAVVGVLTKKTPSTAQLELGVPSLPSPSSGPKAEEGGSGVAEGAIIAVAVTPESEKASSIAQLISTEVTSSPNQSTSPSMERHQCVSHLECSNFQSCSNSSKSMLRELRQSMNCRQFDGGRPYDTANFHQNQRLPCAANSDFSWNVPGERNSTFGGSMCNFKPNLRPYGHAWYSWAYKARFGGSWMAAGYHIDAGNTEVMSSNPKTDDQPSVYGLAPPLQCGAPLPLPYVPSPARPPPLPFDPLPPPPPPLPSDSPPPPPPPLPSECTPSPEPEEMDWMELDSPEHENRLDLETVCIDNATVDAHQAPRNSSQQPQHSEDPKSPNGSDLAGKDPVSLNRTTDDSTNENYSKRRNIPVFIEPPDYPYSRLSIEQMTIIENNILDAILEIDEIGGRPKFNATFRRSGRYGVICDDDFSRKWLYAYMGTHKPWPKSNLRIVSKDYTEVRAKAVLPICSDDNERILRFIGRQNIQLDVKKWEVVRRWESDDFKTLMNLIIDDKSAEVLENCSTVDFKFGIGKIIVQKEVDSDVGREPKKATEFDTLEDDIYADFYDENSSSNMGKNADFDSLEHDIYADFYEEKQSHGESSDDENVGRRDYSRQGSRAKSGSERTQRRGRDRSPSREKIPKRRWSPKPGGGLSSSQDPYTRREYLFQLSRWFQRSRSPVPPDGQDWYSQKYRRRRKSPSNNDGDDSPGIETASKLSGSSKNLKVSVETSKCRRARTRFSSRSPTPDRPSQLEEFTTFPRVLSFQMQGLPDDTEDDVVSSLFPKAKDGDRFGIDFKLAVRQSSELNLESPPGLRVARDASELPDSPTPVQCPENVAADLRPTEDGHVDTEDQEPTVPAPDAHFAQGLQDDVRELRDADPYNSGTNSFYRESSSSLAVHRDSEQHDTADDHVEEIQASDSDSQDSDELPSVEVRPGQALQDVATAQFRKLIAAGYTCEKALQLAQAFVSKQLAKEQPPKPPSPQPPPKPSLHEVSAEKFTKLIEAGVPHAKALQFTQAFVRRQLGQWPPPH